MTDKNYVEKFIDTTLSLEVRVRAMMGEYVVYYRDIVIGGLYDNRFLVKVTDGSAIILGDREKELPYPGAKLMYRVKENDDLSELFEALYNDLIKSQRRKK